jgi:TonB family protein
MANAAGFLRSAAAAALMLLNGGVQAQQGSAAAAPAEAAPAAAPVDCTTFKHEERWRGSRTEQRPDGSAFTSPQMRLAQPLYPAKELREGLSGTVLMEFTIEVDGKPTELEVRQTPGPAFSEYARASVLCSQYRPATLNGTPVAMRVRLPFRYEIQE